MRTDGHVEVHRRFLRQCERARKLASVKFFAKKKNPTAASGRIRKLNEVASRVKRHAVALQNTKPWCLDT